ncbi:MAG: hypothetical protein HKL85_01780 [Acidimicrobiaceae bacterium]|nr:hypothetical protein [Acidimicrobiaceae bacterium]
MSWSDELILEDGDALTPTWKRTTTLYLVFYFVVSMAVFWPSPPWDPSRLPSGFFSQYAFGDPPQMTWYLDWFPYAIRHGLDIFHTNLIDYPTGVNLASNTSVPLLGLIASPITLTLGPVAAFNILLRLAFFSSASSMFLVLRNWSRQPAAFIGGILYGFGPYMVTEGQSHLNLVFVPIPPLIIWCFYELLVVRRRSPIRMGLLLGALAGAQALIAPELLTMLAIVIAVGFVGVAVANRDHLRATFDDVLRAAPSSVGVFLVMTGYWIWSLLLGTGHVVGTVLQLGNLQQYRADLLGLIVPTDQLFAPMKLQVVSLGYVGGNFTENLAYLSLPLVALVAVFAIVRRRNRLVLVSALLALVAFVLSLGSSLSVDNHLTGIPLPEAVFAHLPLSDNFIPARFGFVAQLFAVIAFTIGLDQFLWWLRRPHAATVRRQVIEVSGVTGVALALLLLIPQLPFKTTAAPWPPDTISVLKAIPPGSVVLTYPFTLPEYTEAMSWQAALDMRFRLIGGYATVQGGRDYGQQYQDLLHPSFVQEFLTRAQGTSSWVPFYPAPDLSLNPTTQLCTFVTKYHVGAVIYWKAGKSPKRALHFFTEALGSATKTTHDGTVKLWLLDSKTCG